MPEAKKTGPNGGHPTQPNPRTTKLSLVLLASLIASGQAATAESGSVSYRSSNSMTIAMLERAVAKVKNSLQVSSDQVDLILYNRDLFETATLTSAIQLNQDLTRKLQILEEQLKLAKAR